MKARRFLELQEQDAVHGLRVTGVRLKDDLADLSLVPVAADRHPLLTLGAGVGAGFAAGKLAAAVAGSRRKVAKGAGKTGGWVLRGVGLARLAARMMWG